MSPIYLVSKSLKRNSNIWLFGALNQAFLDNGKYLFLHVVKNHPEIEAYFVCQDRRLLRFLSERNLPCLDKWSTWGISRCLEAGYYIISAYVEDINFWTSGGAQVINLWHGIPLKKIEFDIITGRLARRYQKPSLKDRLFKPWFFHRPDFVVSTSREVSKLFASAFRIPEERCPAVGYPRNDIFFAEPDEILLHIRRYEPQALMDLYEKMASYRYVLLYMPTWRDDRIDFLKSALLDLQSLNAILSSQDALLLLKLHPNDQPPAGLGNLTNIKAIDTRLDVYPLLKFTTALITDYSSVYFDYMLLKKPIIFYPFDLEEYRRMRGFYFEYSDVVPGPIAKDFKGLVGYLSDIGNLGIGDNYRDLLNRFWLYQDGKSCERIVEFLKAL